MKMKFIPGLLLLIAVASGFVAPRYIVAQTKTQKINRLLSLYSSAGQFNGAALVTANGTVLFRGAFGNANLEWNVPNTPDTKFRIGSITKSFTAILALQLVEQGKLKLDGKITNYLPDFSRKNGDRITINQLLTHTSGLPDYNNVPEFFRLVQSGLLSDADILKRISEYDLLFEPGTKFNYSNDGYRVLGAIIERVTGKSYPQVLREKILDPVGMKNSGYSSRNFVVSKRASGYQKSLTGIENAPYYEASPASGMYSTVDDLYLWGQALEGNSLLSATSKSLMWSVSPYGNAYGWLIPKLPSGPGNKIMAEGAVFGFFARFVVIPRDKYRIILLTNVRGGTNYLPEIEEGITNALYGKPYRSPKQSIAEFLLSIIKRRGVEDALREYHALKNARSEAYNFGVNELNSLGYLLIRTRKISDAIAIFKLNTGAYPQSSNAFDSLGEAYMIGGDKERAILNYQRAVELNPQNSNAVEKLKRLGKN
jgi:CubicO group peptidase (beta-lactamase class C family)